MKTIALAIPTLAREDRARETSLQRTCDDLGIKLHDGSVDNISILSPVKTAKLFTDRMANWALGQVIFQWLAHQETDFVGVAQDDIRFHPDGWKMVEGMLAARPDDIIGLHASHPACRQLFVEGGIAWASTRDGLVGTMWLMPTEVMREAVEFGITQLGRGQLQRLHEDDFLGVFAMATGRKIYHPVVSPMDHDVSVASAYGNDNHVYRRPAVTAWDLRDHEPFGRDWTNPDTWRSEVAHLGYFYKNLADHLPVVLRDTDLGVRLRTSVARDVCPERFHRFFRAM